MRKISLLFALLAVFAFLLFPPVTESAGLVPCGETGNPCTFCHIFELLKNIIDFFLVPTAQNGGIPVVPLIAVPFLVFGGLFLLIGGANPQWVSRGKSAVTAVVVGLILVYSAWLLVNTFFVFIGVSTFAGIDKWYEIDCSVPGGGGGGGGGPPAVTLTIQGGPGPHTFEKGNVPMDPPVVVAWISTNTVACFDNNSMDWVSNPVFTILFPDIQVDSSFSTAPFDPDGGGWSTGTYIFRIRCEDTVGTTATDQVVLIVI